MFNSTYLDLSNIFYILFNWINSYNPAFPFLAQHSCRISKVLLQAAWSRVALYFDLLTSIHQSINLPINRWQKWPSSASTANCAEFLWRTSLNSPLYLKGQNVDSLIIYWRDILFWDYISCPLDQSILICWLEYKFKNYYSIRHLWTTLNLLLTWRFFC